LQLQTAVSTMGADILDVSTYLEIQN